MAYEDEKLVLESNFAYWEPELREKKLFILPKKIIPWCEFFGKQ